MTGNKEKSTIVLKNVTRRFGRVTAVDGVDLSIEPGEFLTIFGPNGAGKTTLIKLMSGLVRVTAGEITIGGLDISAHHDKLRERIGLISHQTFTYGQLTALENLLFFARLYGVKNIKERSDFLLEEVGLTRRANDMTRGFSRGMLQRLSIARALIHDPQILFLDEPFTGLDQHASETLKRSLALLHNENRTIIMITHNLKLGLEMGTRAALQVAGKIQFDQPSDQIDHESFAEVYFKAVGEAHY